MSTLSHVAEIVRGTWLAQPPPDARGVWGAAIDSRLVRPGEVFVALRGERTDGHRFLPDAKRAGASMAIVEDEAAARGAMPEGFGVLLVESCREALLAMAVDYRSSTLRGVRGVGVTGSCGKTTTTRLIDAVLGAQRSGTASIKSYNNDLGLSLTILGARERDAYLVCEVGSSGPGEIARLAGVLRPDLAVITSIGRAHLQGLGSIEGVVREKASIALGVAAGGQTIATADSPALRALLRDRPDVTWVGVADDADVRVCDIRSSSSGVTFRSGGAEFFTPLLGAHNASNAAMAVEVARRFGLNDAQIAAALANARPAEMRLTPMQVGDVTVLNDAYNANPESMLAAIGALASWPGAQRRVAVLGDMLELGPEGPSAHTEIGAALARVDRLGLGVFIGPAMSGARRALVARRERTPTLFARSMDEETALLVAGQVRAGDVVLLKGSRGMRMERLISALSPSPAGAR
ncbi:MAG: UDP-N-acetylmuramoyl-tripeptide--D-alanyl-D-alanine ligase [Phycisphaeraceae bacterium]|nr:UDP-N-acetylmuramoyl-tripeptide--D-alanyl-D-alanine ligase [Phycisphaeraceae bacterium]